MTGPHGPLPDYGEFRWISDAGQSSIPAMTALCRSSGLPFTIGSGYRPGDPLWHGQENAIDIFSSPSNMTQIAAYLYNYSDFLLELIFCTDLATRSGYFVDNGKRYEHFSEKTCREHTNHVHLASTNSALRAASMARGKLRRDYNPVTGDVAGHSLLDAEGHAIPTQPVESRSGCPKGANVAALILFTLSPLADFMPHLL